MRVLNWDKRPARERRAVATGQHRRAGATGQHRRAGIRIRGCGVRLRRSTGFSKVEERRYGGIRTTHRRRKGRSATSRVAIDHERWGRWTRWPILTAPATSH